VRKIMRDNVVEYLGGLTTPRLEGLRW